MADAVRPSERLRALFPEPVAAFESCAPGSPDLLEPEEASYVARAVPKRVAEFAAGRACARAALAELGIKGFALRVGPDREPLWPSGVIGSITHAEGFCAAVVARRGALCSLGIDVERQGVVRTELWRHVATDEERARLGALAPAEARSMATLLFSAKEAFFKCQHPLTRQWVNFADVSIETGAGSFLVRAQRALQLEAFAPGPWTGRFTQLEGLIATAISLPAASAPAVGRNCS